MAHPAPSSPRKTVAVCTWKLEFIVMHNVKLQQGYLPSGTLSPLPLHSVLEKQSHRSLNLLWQTMKSSRQAICSLPVFPLSPQFCPRKAPAQCAYCGSQRKAATRVSALAHTTVPAVEHLSVAPICPFVLEQAKYTLPKVLQEEE